jgi:hypothetical protein
MMGIEGAGQKEFPRREWTGAVAEFDRAAGMRLKTKPWMLPETTFDGPQSSTLTFCAAQALRDSMNPGVSSC